MSTKRKTTLIYVNNIPVLLCRQSNGKIDNVLIQFGEVRFDPAVLQQVYQMDPLNCYPYVIISNDNMAVLNTAKELGIADAVIVFGTNHDPLDIISKMLMASAISKGYSKGKNAKASKTLDAALLQYVQELAHRYDPLVLVRCPNDVGSTNEDIRMSKNNVDFFAQENKRISQMLNITERIHMVAGKGLQTKGRIYDLFVSFIGYQISFLDTLVKQGTQHIADAYVEFTQSEQKMFTNPRSLKLLMTSKQVMIPVDSTDLSKGLTPGKTMEQYYIDKITQNC